MRHITQRRFNYSPLSSLLVADDRDQPLYILIVRPILFLVNIIRKDSSHSRVFAVADDVELERQKRTKTSIHWRLDESAGSLVTWP